MILVFISVIITFGGCTFQVEGQNRPEYTIYRAGTPILVDGRLDEPAWTAAPDVGSFIFPRHESGKKEQTIAKLLWNDTHLYVAFISEDAHIWAEHTQHDSSVWKDDTVEVFTAPDPDQPNVYFNIEMNVLGIFLDQFHPEGPGVRSEEEWDGKGLQIKTTIVGTLNDESDEDEYWILEAAIPFANFAQVAKNTPPLAGDVWHLNVNRLGGRTNPQHSQWSETQRSFHDPDGFGKVTFSVKASPFMH